jgi:hypothetical protein
MLQEIAMNTRTKQWYEFEAGRWESSLLSLWAHSLRTRCSEGGRGCFCSDTASCVLHNISQGRTSMQSEFTAYSATRNSVFYSHSVFMCCVRFPQWLGHYKLLTGWPLLWRRSVFRDFLVLFSWTSGFHNFVATSATDLSPVLPVIIRDSALAGNTISATSRPSALQQRVS